MHPRPPGRHIGIDSQPLILSFELNFLCADMFPVTGKFGPGKFGPSEFGPGEFAPKYIC